MFSGKATAAFCSDLRNKPREFAAYLTFSSTPPASLPFYLANGYREGEWREDGPVPADLFRFGKRLP